jgi:predicted DNA-binding transcriptional regulator AlpA
MARSGGEVERLLTVEDVADLLRVKVETIHQWRYLGKGPQAVKAGRKFLRFRPRDVADWIDSQTERKPGAMGA